MRLRRMGFILLMCSWELLNTGCSYMVKNDQHQIYLKAKYGMDRFVVVRGYNIHYIEAGKGEPIFLIPGAFSTYRHWNRVIPYLSENYKLFGIDYLGVGDSDKPRYGFGYTIEEQADLLVEMVEKMRISRVHIVGVSYGGAIALNMAARYPERVDKVVCVEGNGIKHQNLPYRPIENFLRWPMIGEIPVGLIRSGLADRFVSKSVMGKSWGQMGEAERKEIIEIVSQNNKMASRVSWHRISRTIETSKDFTDEAKTIQAPILYLYGRNSSYHEMAEMNAEFLKNHLPNVKTVWINDGIHDLELQKPEEVATLILKFLTKSQRND